MIPDLKLAPHTLRLAKLKLWSFKERRIRDDLIEAYKMVHGLSSIKLETFFEVDYDNRTHGHDWKLQKREVIQGSIFTSSQKE